ncbi:MAG: TRAP transporter large permease subunit [Lachnospiraceae bacterium]|jgi:hypothetical protein|nr:TRAP transporter large permease subunit [Lachnospiraceae bacterium]
MERILEYNSNTWRYDAHICPRRCVKRGTGLSLDFCGYQFMVQYFCLESFCGNIDFDSHHAHCRNVCSDYTIIVILGPMLMPVCQGFGIADVQFGMIMLLALCIAFVTPPVTTNLFIAPSMTGLDMLKIAKRSIPFIGGLLITLLLIILVPSIESFKLDLLR